MGKDNWYSRGKVIVADQGSQPVVVCLAKGLGRARLSAAWRESLKAGRLLVISPFADNVRRVTSAQAQIRNEFVAALASVVLIPHAAPGGRAEAVARLVLRRGQPLFTFEDDGDSSLIRLGAFPYDLEQIKKFLTAAQDDQGNLMERPSNFAYRDLPINLSQAATETGESLRRRAIGPS
jgi:predicted Rossmann fold nucleotide-binding protein DprA/Smf involved in DNA uptake